MIHIERTQAPKALQSSLLVQPWRQRAKEFFNRPLAERSQERFPFQRINILSGLDEALTKMFHSKCAYCESKVSFPEYEIANHRPRSGAIELAGTLSPDHYWWIAYEWFNLYLVCTVCNRLKGNRFPVDGERAKILASEANLKKEPALLLDPCVDYPEDELIFDGYGNVVSKSKRGRTTIDVLNLNRTELVAKRLDEFSRLLTYWNLAIHKHANIKLSKEHMEALYHPDLEFLAMRRQYLQQFSLTFVEKHPEWEGALKPFLSFRTAFKHQLFSFDEGSGSASIPLSAPSSSHAVKGAIKKTVKDFQAHQVAQENYSLEDSSQKEQYFAKARLIERIEISNFKVIQHLSINFPLASQDRGSWLLLLGENATGKSTVLQAVALALMGDKARKKFAETSDASKFVRYGCEEGYIRVTLTGITTPIEIKFHKHSKTFKSKDPKHKDLKVLLLGYGATRLLPRRGSLILEDADTEFSKPYNLFNPFIPLTDASPWLYSQEGDFFTSAKLALKELLLLKGDDQIIKEHRTKRIQIERKVGKQKKETVYLEDLSAGYQSVLALSTDIMSVLFHLWHMPDAMRFAEGIVLLDEIDAHLHPQWKMQIVQRLRNCFPRVQFLVTSHEPLILRGLNVGEVIVMTRSTRGKISAITEDLPNPKALRVDQLLTSEYFGLRSTISPELDNDFNEYYRLLALPSKTEKQGAKLEELKEKLAGLELMGNTPRERMMLEVIDEFLAIKPKVEAKESKRLEAQTRKKMLKMWEEI